MLMNDYKSKELCSLRPMVRQDNDGMFKES